MNWQAIVNQACTAGHRATLLVPQAIFCSLFDAIAPDERWGDPLSLAQGHVSLTIPVGSGSLIILVSEYGSYPDDLVHAEALGYANGVMQREINGLGGGEVDYAE